MSKLTGTPSDLTLPQIFARFPDEASAIRYLEELRWEGTIVCPHCSNNDQTKFWVVTPSKSKKVRVGLRTCAACKKQFRVTVGTVFEDSHIPLNLWIVAWYLLCGAKKGMSALQLQRHLGLGSYKSAWFMCHRIRHAMETTFFPDKMKGTVEVDECYFGPQLPRSLTRSKNWKRLPKGKKYIPSKKSAVIAIVERSTGKRRSVVLKHFQATAENIRKIVTDNVEPGSTINTDEHHCYRALDVENGGQYKHAHVRHGTYEYWRREKDGTIATTNFVEGSFSWLRRGVVGSFHHISRKHLSKYVAEFDFRWNSRELTDGKRTVEGLKTTFGKRITYKMLLSSK